MSFGGLGTAHTARTAQQLLTGFRTLADWLPYSLDFSPLDYAICGVLQMKNLLQSGRPMSIYRPRMGPVTSGIHLQDLLLILLLLKKLSLN
jgi:hypothetical protein